MKWLTINLLFFSVACLLIAVAGWLVGAFFFSIHFEIVQRFCAFACLCLVDVWYMFGIWILLLFNTYLFSKKLKWFRRIQNSYMEDRGVCHKFTMTYSVTKKSSHTNVYTKRNGMFIKKKKKIWWADFWRTFRICFIAELLISFHQNFFHWDSNFANEPFFKEIIASRKNHLEFSSLK